MAIAALLVFEGRGTVKAILAKTADSWGVTLRGAMPLRHNRLLRFTSLIELTNSPWMELAIHEVVSIGIVVAVVEIIIPAVERKHFEQSLARNGGYTKSSR
jgi:hypothetical protein